MWKRAYARTYVDERDRIIDEFVPIVRHLAYKVSRSYDDGDIIEDLISAGIVGLLEAMEKYDESKGNKLNTFAYLRIRGAMIDELRSRDWFPRSARSKSKQLNEVIRKLENKLGRLPSEEEVAETMGIGLEDYFKMLKDYGNLSVLSIEDLYELLGEDKEKVIRYVMDESDDPEKCAEMYELEGLLTKEFDKLPERQKFVLNLYYHEDINMKEIARVLGITEARICQIHSQAIMNLRVSMKKYLKN
ncbi:MAG: polymerase, sigma 28 subunit, FliA/WhiG subfamily [Deltaproteobacteria bacterium]|nr:polymerase, sigma 28 subunit, FliA/WhiG subfamily [Deltaproteobacteria bacterium]